MCMCSFGGAAVLQTYDPSQSQVKKFKFTPGEGLTITFQGAAPSEARRPGNKFWPEEDQEALIQTAMTGGT
ncbi:MAG: hypothetical protein M5U01_36480 [Ardenticatenaceae bacterium]|nr:hypothetical protein [Ardenticatenaceae bacterium]HBY92429.1 hypothetical protein [Chloroflexota bacterium]